MAAPGNAPISVVLDSSRDGAGATNALLAAMLRAHGHVSDLIFSPGRFPQIEVSGQLTTVQGPGVRSLTADDTRQIASELIGNNKQAINMLREQGSCDFSYGLPGLARFRVNVFIQRGSCAVVMRVISTEIPDFASLNLPPSLAELANLRDGIVLVTGPRGCGKSSTLAALLDSINQRHHRHILTIENPIEFLHNHKQSTVHQRELHSDTPSVSLALRAAMRQAPDVILVSESADRETFDTMLEAAETGHLVLSSMNTVDAAKTLERIAGMFPAPEQAAIRGRLARSLRCIISQRLIPRNDLRTRVPVIEVLKLEPRMLEGWKSNTSVRQILQRAMKRNSSDGAQSIDGEIEKLVRAGILNRETALTHASEPEKLQQALANLGL